MITSMLNVVWCRRVKATISDCTASNTELGGPSNSDPNGSQNLAFPWASCPSPDQPLPFSQPDVHIVPSFPTTNRFNRSGLRDTPATLLPARKPTKAGGSVDVFGGRVPTLPKV